MAFISYLPQPFSTTHENVFFRQVTRQLRNRYGRKEGLSVLVGNLSCMGHQIDALFVATGKIIVIDFKNYGGKLEFSENNTWVMSRDNELVSVLGGGSTLNPYRQVNAYRHALRQYLQARQDQILSHNHEDCNWSHISAMVLFHQAIQFDVNSIPPRLQSYFSVVDHASFYARLDDSFTEGLILEDNEIQRLLIALDIRDENIYDESAEVEDEPTPNDRSETAAQRLDLIRRVSPDVKDLPDLTRVLYFYHTLVNLERYKEPTCTEVHSFPVNWAEVIDEVEVDVESNPSFNALYQSNLHAQFPRNIFVGISVRLSDVTIPLLRSIIFVADILDHRRIPVRLADFALNVTELERRNFGEDIVDELTARINEADTLEEKLQTVREYLSVNIDLLPSIDVGLSEESGMTGHLMAELRSIIRRADALGNDVLRHFLLMQPLKRSTSSIPRPLICITPLNKSQRLAVELSFQQPLTVITGPPGTGKTQVVLNILANAVLHDKKVLFASKNNKAVDNVREKLARLVREPDFFVRFGSRAEVKDKVKPILQQFSNRISHGLIDDNESEYEDAMGQVKRAEDKRSHYVMRQESRRRIEKEMRLLIGKHGALQADLESFTRKYGSELAVPVNWLYFLRESCANQLRSLRRYRGFFGGIWFVLTQKNRFLRRMQLTKSELPQDLFRRSSRLDYGVSSHNALMDWYRLLSETVDSLIGLHEEYNQKKIEVDSMSGIISKMNAELCDLKESLERDQDEFYEIEQSMPALGLNALNQKIQRNLFGAGEDYLERFIQYVPEGIPRREQEIPPFEEAALRFLDTFCAVSVTSLSVRNGFPLSEGLFDLIVIDEASQCDIASAIPLIYRGKRLVVIGDPLQLKHISKVEAYEEKYLIDRLELNGYPLSYVDSSLYDYCDSLAKRSRLRNVLLIEHYRCHPDIIQYSNEVFYCRTFGQELAIQTKEEDFSFEPKGIYWIDTTGTQHSERNLNISELNKTIELVTKLAKRHSSATIGITTPFRDQAKELNQRIPDSIRNRVTADTVHRFQGDEKDIMIVSLVLTRNSGPRKVNWINHKVPYLINVAVTRAKSTLFIVGDAGYCLSLPPESPLGYLVRYVDSLGNRR